MISLKTVIFKGYFNLRYVRYSQCGSNFCSSDCSIDIQQADNIKELTKMINYCQFSVDESTIS